VTELSPIRSEVLLKREGCPDVRLIEEILFDDGPDLKLQNTPDRVRPQLGNVEAAEKRPPTYGKRVVRRRVYRFSNRGAATLGL
jgi:hypothetical protein